MGSKSGDRAKVLSQWQKDATDEQLPSDHDFLDGVRRFCENDYQEALRKFGIARMSSPDNPVLIAACGHTWLHSGELDKAAEEYDKALSIKADFPEVKYCYAKIHLHRGEAGNALEIFEALLKTPPSINPGRFYLGLHFKTSEEFLIDVSLQLGRICRERGEIQKSRSAFKKVIELDPENITAHQKSAELAIYTKEFTTARRHLEKVLELSPLEEDKINAHNNLGLVWYELGGIDKAIFHLKWVLHHAPGNPSAIHNLNHIYEKEGVFSKSGPLPPAIRFMDMREGASPIFELTGTEQLARGIKGLSIVGKSQEMLRVLRHARVAAAGDSSVLITGEKGVGKELIARTIHLNSDRSQGPFVVFHCGNLPEVTLESELFGHEKGAFTGAHSARAGKIENAAEGTLFLDEVTELTPRLQSRLLRAMQEKRFTSFGGTHAIPLRCRLICASVRDLSQLVKEEKFREDLYYLINVLPIHIEPLRDRVEDISLLIEHFSRKHSRKNQSQNLKLTREDMEVLEEYDWPGNVRELENLVQRALVLGSQSNLYLEELAKLRRARGSGDRVKKLSGIPSDSSYPVDLSLAEIEKRHILNVLEDTEHNQKKAAERLGINPSTLWRKLKVYGIDIQAEKMKKTH